MKTTLFGETFQANDKAPGVGSGIYGKWLDESFNVEWCLEQPCLCRGNNFCLLTHVDDILYCGSRQFWNDVFLPTFQRSFTVSYSMVEGVGSEINMLKRKIQRLDTGLALVPGTNFDAVVSKFEEKYGRVRCHYSR